MNRRLTKAFIGALSFAAALSTAVVCNASDAQAKKASVKKVTASAPSGKKVYVANIMAQLSRQKFDVFIMN